MAKPLQDMARVRVYESLRELPWQAQAIYPRLRLEVDPGGHLDLPPAPDPGTALSRFLPEWDAHVVRAGLEQLLAVGWVELGEGLLIPGFAGSERAAKSGALRARELRERRKACVTSRHGRVARRDDSVTKSDGSVTRSDGSVTDCDGATEAVTIYPEEEAKASSLPAPVERAKKTLSKPAQDQKRVLAVFTELGAREPKGGPRWGRMLSRYRKECGEGEAGLEALIADLRGLGANVLTRGSGYVLACLGNRLEQGKAGKGRQAAPRRTDRGGGNEATLAAVAALDGDEP